MTDHDGVFVYNAAKLVSGCIEIVFGPLDILDRQAREACVEIAVYEAADEWFTGLWRLETNLQDCRTLLYTDIKEDFSLSIHYTQSS